ncbi:MAG: alpha 1,2 mannosyltransferase [Thelocarpon impressellum]|nr:MAG: alpha 1,2 mannosyltransferase [Thelocarpon impressellum]
MWRRAYLVLVLVRLYFALSPSYLHPDENFQGPEVIAGQIFTYPVHLTWEFTSERPIRSVFPLWPVYGLPMLLLNWVWSDGAEHHDISPAVVFWTLRVLMFVLSFVLEDWAIHELVQSPRHQRAAVLLVASSYVTWTFQTHTFSNSIETLLVAWSLVLIQRILADKQRSSLLASGILGFLATFGIFNRITFPAFLLIPGVRLIPHFARKPFSLLSIIISGALTTFVAIYLDTTFYNAGAVTFTTVFRNPVITPLNNLLYNSDSKNLAAHGLHPHYQHFVANLPQLLGPAFLLLFTPRYTLRLASAVFGILVLSLAQHQEARFLIPAVPLILSSVRVPTKHVRGCIAAWIGFNAVFGVLMGVYHQGGVIPTQMFLAGQQDATDALWWRTYTPPIWLLDGKNEELTTKDLMGMSPDLMMDTLGRKATCRDMKPQQKKGTYLIAPESSTFLDRYTSDANATGEEALHFERKWHYRNHLNLDDLDVAADGLWQTLKRVVGRRGLTAWRVTKMCA